MRAEKEKWQEERATMEAWLGEKRAETESEARELETALGGVRELWGRVAASLRGRDARRARRQMEGRWTHVESALARERQGLREEARGERRQKEGEREQADRARAGTEERRALERTVWEKEREGLEEVIAWKSRQVDTQRRRATDALQEKEKMVAGIWEAFAAMASSDWLAGGAEAAEEEEEAEREQERMAKEQLKREIWGEVELMDLERQRAEAVMLWEMARMEGEIRKLRRQREAARAQMELASRQMELARKRVEEAALEREHMMQELRKMKEIMEEERGGGAGARRRRVRAWCWPMMCCHQYE